MNTAMKLGLTRLSILFWSACAVAPVREGPTPDTGRSTRGHIVLSEFQVWADAASPEVFEKLNERYLARGRSHVFELYPRYDYFVWEFPRMQRWIDEAVGLGAFNVFCIGDDTRTAQGHLFDHEGVNPELRDFLYRTIAYAHERGLMVAVEPKVLPRVRAVQQFVPWLRSWVGPDVPRASRADIIKLSIEWFGAYQNALRAEEIEAFFVACSQAAPEVLVYVDSIGGIWRQPQPFHRWLLHRFPGTILSHYLNTDQVAAFRGIGARNLMVQINPSETWGAAGQFFIYHDKTVASLKSAVDERVRYLCLAGVNFGYSRYNYDLFLEVIRPHLNLAPDVATLRETLVPDQIREPASKDDVRQWMARQAAAAKAREAGRELPVPRNVAGRPMYFGSAPEGCTIRRLAAIGDGDIGPRFAGANTDPFLRRAVRATFGVDFGQSRTIRRLRVVPCLHPEENVYLATDLRLEYRVDGEWKALPGGVIRRNTQPEIRLQFAPCRADAVRLVVEAETDDGDGNYRACCQELVVE